MHGRWTLVYDVGANSAEGYAPWVLSFLLQYKSKMKQTIAPILCTSITFATSMHV